MDILKSSQLAIFSHSTIFITFSYRSLQVFSSNSYEVRGGENRKWRLILRLTAVWARACSNKMAQVSTTPSSRDLQLIEGNADGEHRTLSFPKARDLLVQPSSAAAERVFSILKACFNEQENCALVDYLQASVMSQYHKR